MSASEGDLQKGREAGSEAWSRGVGGKAPITPEGNGVPGPGALSPFTPLLPPGCFRKRGPFEDSGRKQMAERWRGGCLAESTQTWVGTHGSGVGSSLPKLLTVMGTRLGEGMVP